eukprot:gnl/Hemi2/26882_TR9048_c0_g1_i1.p1 gnl/Hemi2/26882_TR9048_c0_g1~~gnl/Hemi2/26882_TR9048_c0_g1_i1.p1  ORF type:complete len:769 (-),score=241.55 gnl/Hemi2/26882_TR9048_c0_g1_i1:48-2156(-)
MCIQRPPHNWSEQLYERYCSSIEDYLKTTVLPAIQSKHDEFVLLELVKRWDSHVFMIKTLSKFFFTYLDRFHVKRLNLPTLYEVGMQKFKTVVFDTTKHDTLGRAVNQIITQEREGERVNRGLLKSAIQIFVEMGMGNLDVYTHDFEDVFLVETCSFYTRESARWVVEDGTPDYMRKAEKRLQEEEARVELYLHSTTREKLLNVCETALLAVHQEQLLLKPDTGIRILLANEQIDDLKRVFRLYQRVPNGLIPVANHVKLHMTAEGTKIVKSHDGVEGKGSKAAAAGADAEKSKDKEGKESKDKDEKNDNTFIPKMIEYHDKCLSLVNGCFEGNSVFHKAMKEAFEVFMNMKVGKATMAEMMATYCDSLLKKDCKMSEQQIEEMLEKVVMLFGYIQEKDVFAEFYRKLLAKRLLMGRSANDDAERSMISKLKLRQGAQFTTKLEGMITDMTLAANMQSSFNDWLSARPSKPNIDINVQVLTSGFWPTYKAEEIQLPQELLECVGAFKAFFDTRTEHRVLRWVHSLGLVTLTGLFPKRRKELVVSTAQACVLLLFNQYHNVSNDDVKRGLNISDDEVTRIFASLAGGKYKILNQNEDKSYSFNADFTSKQNKIKIPVLITHIQRTDVQRVVQEDRKHAVEAAIVRIMKMRKVLPHQQLMVEVLEQLKQFKPEPKIIKSRIEDLIQREYLERDPNNSAVFRYLA